MRRVRNRTFSGLPHIFALEVGFPHIFAQPVVFSHNLELHAQFCTNSSIKPTIYRKNGLSLDTWGEFKQKTGVSYDNWGEFRQKLG